MPVAVGVDQRGAAGVEVGPAVADLHADIVSRRYRPAELPVQCVVVGTSRQNGLAKRQIFTPACESQQGILSNTACPDAADPTSAHHPWRDPRGPLPLLLSSQEPDNRIWPRPREAPPHRTRLSSRRGAREGRRGPSLVTTLGERLGGEP